MALVGILNVSREKYTVINMTLYIKNMVCKRCKMVVEDELNKLEIPLLKMDLGVVALKEKLSDDKKRLLSENLERLGFEIIDDKKSRLIEQIKSLIISLVQNQEYLQVNLSEYLSQQLHYDYNYLSNLFSDVEGKTIEKYYIAQKIEKVKEWLMYDEFTLNEIADKLNYSSAAYLSSQFKKVTGLTPGFFKNKGGVKRKSLDQVG